ncbi:MAG TPA: hypothetical protein PKZ77_03220 [Pseudomonadales bacterium]|nr:hypothetical protein [Pseudomonadales bacterium]
MTALFAVTLQFGQSQLCTREFFLQSFDLFACLPQQFDLGVELFASHQIEARERALGHRFETLLHVLAQRSVADEATELIAEAAQKLVFDHHCSRPTGPASILNDCGAAARAEITP